jgi:hypothetical protein
MRRLGILVAATTLLTAAPASAATFTVTTTNDGGACSGTSCPSIRAALNAAAQFGGPDTIVVPAGTHQLVDQGNGGELLVNSPVTIVGAGARATSVVGSGTGRVFTVTGSPVTIASLTMAGGNELCCDSGGNLLNTAGSITLDHVRVTGGRAGEGGGVANVNGTMTIQSSLIDGNDLTGHDSRGDGGGILNHGLTAPATLTVRDSTVAGNISTDDGAGISSDSTSFSTTTTLERVTVARNRSSSGIGGIRFLGAGTFTVRGSIIDDNLLAPASSAPVELNCTTSPAISSGGGNVAGTGECPFAASGDVVGVNALLSAALVNAGGQTDVLTISANSPAIDRNPGCVALDQRDVSRPQGAACDSGAYEHNFEPDTSLSASGSGRTRTFAFGASEGGATFQCRLDGPAGTGAFAPCSSPMSFANLPGGRYTFYVRAVDALGVPDSTPAATTFDVARNALAGQRVVVGEVRGRVRVKVPGGKYVDLNTLTEIPDGSVIDTRNGVVRLSFEPRPGAKTQKAKFYDGIFRLDQRKKIMELVLVEKLAKCKRGDASSAARRKRSRRLWGDGNGRFRTKGQYSSATVRGTKWLTQDSCAGTLTKVRKGKVSVRDFVRKKTIRLKKGQQYLARPKP